MEPVFTPNATASAAEQDKEEAYAAKEVVPKSRAKEVVPKSRSPPGSSSPPPWPSSPPAGSSSRPPRSSSCPPPGSSSSYRQGAKRIRKTDILVNWLEEHPINPYPNKSTKIYLACMAGISVRQLNYWFANKRRNMRGGMSRCKNSLRKRKGGVVPLNYLVTNQAPAVHGIDSRGMFGTATTPVTPAFGSLSAVPPTPAGLHQNSYGMPPAACNCAHGQQSSPTYSHFTFATNHLP